MTAPERRTVARTFEPNAESPRLARRFVAQALDDLDAESAHESAVLLASELVTNAVLHARTRLDVTVSGAAGVIRVSVTDRSPTHPTPRTFSDTAGSGRGLHLVGFLSSRWGVDPLPDGAGKAVWFELELGDEPAAAEFDFDSVPSL